MTEQSQHERPRRNPLEATWLTTDCIRCDEERQAAEPFEASLIRRMILCPTCGNKRCPHATDHRLACTGSNEPDQPGSRYQTGSIRLPPVVPRPDGR